VWWLSPWCSATVAFSISEASREHWRKSSALGWSHCAGGHQDARDRASSEGCRMASTDEKEVQGAGAQKEDAASSIGSQKEEESSYTSSYFRS
jgi:hypothetical protein